MFSSPSALNLFNENGENLKERNMKTKLLIMMLTLFFTYQSVEAKLCPDGTYVGGNKCKLCPDGSYVGGSRAKLCPDGSYVSGTRCKLQPDGSYTGR